MGFLQTYTNLNLSGVIFTLKTPNHNGILFTNRYSSNFSSQVLSDYTLAMTSGISSIAIWHKKNGIENNYIFQNLAAQTKVLQVEYDPTDNMPSIIYTNRVGWTDTLYYAKLVNSTWIHQSVDNVFPTAIQLKYDPIDNYPAIALSAADYTFRYYKYDGASFIRTDFPQGNGLINYVTQLNLTFHPTTKYPVITYSQGNPQLLGTEIKMLKYNGGSWVNSTIIYDDNTYKTFVDLKFDSSNRETIIYRAGTSGLFLGAIRDNQWKTGNYTKTTQNPLLFLGEPLNMQWSFDKVQYFNDKSQINITYTQGSGTKNLIRWIDDTLENTIPLDLSLSSYDQTIFIGDDINGLKYQLDSDNAPVLFYITGNNMLYSKAIEKIDPINGRFKFNSPILFKSLPNGIDNYTSYDIEFPLV